MAADNMALYKLDPHFKQNWPKLAEIDLDDETRKLCDWREYMKKIIRLGTLLISAFGLMISISLMTQAFGQEITGSIVGIVKDSNGAAVSGATVTIKDTDKNIVVRTLTTNSDGEYSAPLLPV